MKKIPIGVFDSGYGGLTILAELLKKMPDYDYVYFGDNARAPYGNRSFDVVYSYTLEAVDFLFKQGCELIIIACNTASAKALRTIQQTDLPRYGTNKRVLGVIRPCTEYIGQVTNSNSIGILGTEGTVNSNSYPIELKKFFPSLHVAQHACPMWVPLIENNMHNTEAGKLIIKSDIEGFLSENPTIDALVLACTHYPVLLDYIKQLVGETVQVVPQGEIVADKLVDYLARHEKLNATLSKGGSVDYYTSENSVFFDEAASTFLHRKIQSQHIAL
jgi:glutamate racemase